MFGWFRPWFENKVRLRLFAIECEICVLSERLEALHELLTERTDRLMALSQELLDLIAKVDATTTAIGARIDTLSQQVKNSMTDAEVAAIKTGLQSEVDKLTALGADPANPVPPVTP